MKLENSSFHFVGIGGVGMSGLAELLHNMGAHVSGSDIAQNPLIDRLMNMGVRVSIGHNACNLMDTTDVLVFSSAIDSANPEIKEAINRKIPIIRRAEVLAEVMRLKRGIAIAGSHGKTTTTSLVASSFIEAGFDPTVVVGGRLDIIKSTSKLGQGEWLIAEADESDGSFLNLSPEIAVITNIDNDHLDHYGTFENLQKTFLDFAQRVPFYGFTVVCGDDEKTRALFQEYRKKIVYYGFEEANDYVLYRIKSGHYKVFCPDGQELEFELQLPGRHNALNALAAIVIAKESSLNVEDVIVGLKNFAGVDRRFQLKGDVGGVSVYDDYGHHPTEISAVISAFKERFPERKVKVAFQPHRYSRTALCWKDFATCFEGADQLWLLDIYPAGEAPIEGITTENLLYDIHLENKQHLPSIDSIDEVMSSLEKGDILVTLGAGNIFKLGEEVLKRLG